MQIWTEWLKSKWNITVTASFGTQLGLTGKPDLSGLDTPELTKRNSKLLKKDMNISKGNLLD
jgi:hypothetical protein